MAPSSSSEDLWDSVFLRVEGRVFRRPRYAFVQNSPVFKDMYHVGDSSTGEGKSEQTPIVLEGYKSDDFEALLMVLYPTANDIIAGKLELTKDQWTGVLRLSRPWEMTKIRQLAIATLSSDAFKLTPTEKVTLARDHKVASWLVEGLSSLTLGEPELSADELEAAVGLRTAFRLSRIQIGRLNKSLISSNLRQGSYLPSIAIDALRCGSCYAPCWSGPFSCHSCNRELQGDDASSTRLFGSGYTIVARPNEVQFGFNLQHLYCGSCSDRIYTKNTAHCISCSCLIYTSSQIYASVGTRSQSPPTAEDSVREAFKDELEEYDV